MVAESLAIVAVIVAISVFVALRLARAQGYRSMGSMRLDIRPVLRALDDLENRPDEEHER